MSAHEQLFGIPRDVIPSSPPSSPSKSDPPTPVFKSAAAKEIIKEMTWEAEKHRRAVPKEKRRHLTISSSRPVALETGVPPEEVMYIHIQLPKIYSTLQTSPIKEQDRF